MPGVVTWICGHTCGSVEPGGKSGTRWEAPPSPWKQRRRGACLPPTPGWPLTPSLDAGGAGVRVGESGWSHQGPALTVWYWQVEGIAFVLKTSAESKPPHPPS